MGRSLGRSDHILGRWVGLAGVSRYDSAQLLALDKTLRYPPKGASGVHLRAKYGPFLRIGQISRNFESLRIRDFAISESHLILPEYV